MPLDDADRRAVEGLPADGISFQLAARWFRDGSSPASTFALLRELRTFGLPIVVTYGPDAAAAAASLRTAAPAGVVVAPNLPFSQWAAVFEKSRVVVTVDTGATHLASAMRRPAVVLFEHRYFHLSSQEWSPYRVASVCLRKPASDAEDDLAASRAQIVAAVGQLLQRS